MSDRLLETLAGGIVLLDAAMGTRLLALGLDLRRDDPCFWNLSRPEVVGELHRRDLAAGSAALLTNTFGANRAWLARLGRAGWARAINRRAVELARDASGPERFVLGSIGPTASDQPGACLEQAELLAEAGVDALFFETHRADQAERALDEVRGGVPLPLLVSLVQWPEPPGPAVSRLIERGARALGGNCQDGMEPALRMAEALRAETSLPLIVKPSAGQPGRPSVPPGAFAAAVPALRRLGAILAGGCCGSTEAHVAALRAGCYHQDASIAPGESRATGEGPAP